MAGFGIDTSVASYEEVATAIKNQNKENKPEDKPEISKATPKQVELIKKLIVDIPAMLKYYNIGKVEDLNVMQASDIIAKKGKKENVS